MEYRRKGRKTGTKVPPKGGRHLDNANRSATRQTLRDQAQAEADRLGEDIELYDENGAIIATLTPTEPENADDPSLTDPDI